VNKLIAITVHGRLERLRCDKHAIWSSDFCVLYAAWELACKQWPAWMIFGIFKRKCNLNQRFSLCHSLQVCGNKLSNWPCNVTS